MKPLRLLVGCEFTATVRKAFAAQGWDAWSCDLLPSEEAGQHFQCDVREVLHMDWNLIIMHLPCTFMANSGVRWLKRNSERWYQMEKDASFFGQILRDTKVPLAMENPIMHKYAVEIIGTRQSQVIQPWMFGHGEQKATCLWLKYLPKLMPTNVVEGREQRIWKMSPGADRGKERSRTFPGIADAMATQWTSYIKSILQ